jgi:NAD(P)-dependent dehydrogenase (short-subunit alcohol dehydrogenase family)
LVSEKEGILFDIGDGFLDAITQFVSSIMFDRKAILITGGSGLIGKAILRTLAGSNSYSIYNLDIAKSEEQGVSDVLCNVTSSRELNSVVQEIAQRHGGVYGLVNNAYPRTKDWGVKFEEESFESLQQNVSMQLTSILYACQVAGRHMTNGGSIVNISSIYGVVGNDPGLYEDTPVSPPGAYPAIKGGLINFTRFLAARWGNRQIRVNCVSPGGIKDAQDPKFIQRYEERVPLKRMGTPDDIAPAVTFLLSDGARYITGQNIIVDGGWTSI